MIVSNVFIGISDKNIEKNSFYLLALYRDFIMEGKTLNKKKQTWSLALIFTVIFLDILGFGMIIPLSPILARDFGGSGLQVGFLISIYAVMQFLSAPLWGRLSDIIGRKPVILTGLFGVTLAHLWFAFASDLTGLFLSRALAGIFGGNIGAGLAYIADVTGKENRSKNMGLIGLAFGLGFALGPFLGWLFISIGEGFGSAPPFGIHFASFGAALLELFNFLFTLFFLKESLADFREKKGKTLLSSFKRPSLFSRPSPGLIFQSLKTPLLGEILFISFILWIALAQLEPTLILLVQDDFGWTKKMAYWGFAYIGFLLAFSQGFLVRFLIPRFGEREVNKWGLLSAAFGLLLIGVSALAAHWNFLFGAWNLGLVLLAMAVTFFSVGYSLANTSLQGALSLLSLSTEQGKIFGVNQSLASIARISGPALGGFLYDFFHSSPFFLAGGMALGAWLLSYRLGMDFPNVGQTVTETISLNEEEIYSVGELQLENLIAKRIHFHFFKMEDFSLENINSPVLKEALSKMKAREKDSIFSLLKDSKKEEPIVLVCKTGGDSKILSRELRDRGYQNTYYIKEGVSGLEKSRSIH